MRPLPGPFDGHEALDFLEHLTVRHADIDGTLSIVPGSVDVYAVTAAIAAEFNAVTAGRRVDGYSVPHSTYTSAGLVAAAALETPMRDAHRRRRRTDPLGLAEHRGHAALLTAPVARTLVPAALDAVAMVSDVRLWRSEERPADVVAGLGLLARTLSDIDQASGRRGAGRWRMSRRR